MFRAGLALEAGDVALAKSIVAGFSTAYPGTRKKKSLAVPGLSFHIACRAGDLASAEEWLATLVEVAGHTRTWGGLSHDLVSAGLAAKFPASALRPLVARLVARPESWRWLLDAQLDEADGQTERALADYRRVVEAAELPKPVLGTANVGAARCLTALGRPAEAAPYLREASRLLARWGGWRAEQLRELREGRDPVDGVLTPREL